ncbi:hypothetical protein KPH14_012284 [Odynerus spinipes]|uniref:Uncharacterized protein n=1 Tax=Odynerus spinipes TaxID=1348599 RepID=A0AAD9RKK1_9HYME|nr:hypothetical protein KPH14_012284 [Odynerus spinipes]
MVSNDIRNYLQAYNETEIDRDECRKIAVEKNRKNQEYNKDLYDKKHKKPRVYKIGDFVLLKNIVTTPAINQKLLLKYKEPYVVDKVLRRDKYLVKDIDGFQLSQKPFSGIFSPDRMKLWEKGNSDDDCDSE